MDLQSFKKIKKDFMRTPNFLIGGSAASGTSQLATMLIQHPDIYLPREMRPEPHYFYKSWEYAKPLSYYLERWFNEAGEEKAVGERSSSYLYMPEVPARVQAVFPDIRWIFCLRNPIERTFANYRYTLLEGFEELSFEEALEQEPQRIAAEKGIFQEIQPHDYTGRGFYGRQLQHLLKYFPQASLLCLKSETLRARPVEQTRRICEFLGVSSSFTPQIAPSFTSPSVREPRIQKQCRDHFQDRFDMVVEYIRVHGDIPSFFETLDKEAAEALRENLSPQKAVMSQDTRRHLMDLFAEDIDLLRSIVDFDTSDWI